MQNVSAQSGLQRMEWRKWERRIEEEKPAGVSGMVMIKAFGSFQLNGERRLDKGLTWCEKYNVELINNM